MTTSSASARPYSVFVQVPRFYGGLITFKDEDSFVDRGLEPGQIDLYEDGGSRAKTVAACILNSLLYWALPAFIVLGYLMSGLVKHDVAQIIWSTGAGVAGICAYIASDWYINKRQKSFDETSALLAQHLVPAPRDGRSADLGRIQRALNTLQGEHGDVFDDRAREAAVAVLDQNLHRPNEKHLIIADSAADDADSVAIRSRTLEAKSKWTRDVANAEHLILVLEDAAAQKVPAAA
jgi:hypothetical protein